MRLTRRGRSMQDQAREIPACILDASGFDADALAQLCGQIASLRTHLFEATRR